MDMTRLILALLACCVCFSVSSKDFTRFSTAKKHLIKTLPHNAKSLYCGCDIKKQGKKLVPDPTGCGYVPRNTFTRSGKVNQRALRSLGINYNVGKMVGGKTAVKSAKNFEKWKLI
jgi:deoxyribonuclease-1